MKKKSSKPNSKIHLPHKKPFHIRPTERTKASRVTDFNIHVRSTLPIIEPDTKCNAPGYKKLCGLSAGHNTDHPGEGRCRTHANRFPVSTTSQRGIRGIYSKGPPTKLRERYEQMLNDPDLLSVNNEMAMLKAFLLEIAEGATDGADLWESEDGRKRAMDFVSTFEKVARLSLRVKELEQKSEFIITLPQLMNIIKQLVQIINFTCKDCPTKNRVTLQRRIVQELDITGKAKAAESFTSGAIDLEE